MNQPKKNHRSLKQNLKLSAIAAAVMMIYGVPARASVTNPVIGSLLYAEEFNGTTLDASVWKAFNGNGCAINLCGFGNQELQTYSPNNVSIQNVPFEAGTRALAIQARAETVGTNAFTSGKITTQGTVQVQYGMVEIRMSAPQVGVGLWPAAWMLGTSPQAWPANGEIDIMEMGHSVANRASSGSTGADINSYVGSNVIFYAPEACSSGNPTCAASTAWQNRNYYIAPTSLANRFLTYRLYWTDQQIARLSPDPRRLTF